MMRSKCFVLLLLGMVLLGGVNLGCGSNNHGHTDHSRETQIERGHAPS
jgi:hypothetical protein